MGVSVEQARRTGQPLEKARRKVDLADPEAQMTANRFGIPCHRLAAVDPTIGLAMLAVQRETLAVKIVSHRYDSPELETLFQTKAPMYSAEVSFAGEPITFPMTYGCVLICLEAIPGSDSGLSPEHHQTELGLLS